MAWESISGVLSNQQGSPTRGLFMNNDFIFELTKLHDKIQKEKEGLKLNDLSELYYSGVIDGLEVALIVFTRKSIIRNEEKPNE